MTKVLAGRLGMVAAAICAAIAFGTVLLKRGSESVPELKDVMSMSVLLDQAVVIRRHSRDGTWEVAGEVSHNGSDACDAAEKEIVSRRAPVLLVLDSKRSNEEEDAVRERVRQLCRKQSRSLYISLPVGGIVVGNADAGDLIRRETLR